MIKASVRYDGAHIWAQHKFKQPVDMHFLFTMLFDIVWLAVCLTYISYLLSYSVLYSELKKLLFIMIFVSAATLWSFYKTISGKLKGNKKLKDTPYDGVEREMIFDDSGFKVDYNSNDEYGSASIIYDGIEKAVEMKDHFVIRVEGNKIYSIGKNELTEGTSEELSKLLADRLGKKFRRKCA